MVKSKSTLLLLLIVLFIAGFFRLWKLSSIPPGLYPDAAIYGNDALESLKTGNFKVFYPENNGREGLFMWLLALSFWMFGVSIWSLKIIPALAGIITVFGVYLLTKEILKNTKYEIESSKISLLSSFFLATSFWHTNFSRIGFRAILLPLILVFGFYFLFRGFQKDLKELPAKKGKIFNFIISGIIFGLGFYTYISYRFVVLLLPLILILWFLLYKRKNLKKQFWLIFICFSLFTIITALPIGFYFLKNPQDFVGRATPISIFATKNPFKEAIKSLILHLGMFNFYGDTNWRHNFSGLPMLPLNLGIFFLTGVITSVKEIVFFRKHKDDFPLLICYALLIFWFLIMLLPGVLTHEGIPHSLRVIGVIPTVYILTSFGFWRIYEKTRKYVKNKKVVKLIVLCFLLVIPLVEFNKYFFLWGKSSVVKSAFTKIFADQGDFLNSLPKSVQKYVIVNEPGVPVPWPKGIPMPAQTIIFIENTKFKEPQSIYLLPEELEKIKIKKQTIILPMKPDEKLFEELKKRFPQGKIKTEKGINYYSI